MRQAVKIVHFWVMVAMMAVGAIVYYADQIFVLQPVVAWMPFQPASYSIYRILSIIPVAYAAFIFRLYGGVITAIFVSLALLPRALFYSTQKLDALSETIAFLFIGVLVSWLIDRQQHAVDRLEETQKQLQTEVQIVKENERRLETRRQVSSAVCESLELNKVLSSAIDSVVSMMQADVAWIFLLDEEAGELVLTSPWGLSEEFVKRKDRIKIGEGLNGRVAQTGEALVVDDASQDPRLTREVISDHNIRSSLIVPLRSKGKVGGTLCIAMHSHRNFRPEEVELLTAIGDEIGVTVENAHLYQQQMAIAQQLRLSEERYRGLFESASEAIFVCSTLGRIVSANRASEQLTGYSQYELSKRTLYGLFSEVSIDRVRQLFFHELGNMTIGETEELHLIKKDGTEAFIQLKTSPLLKDRDVIGLQVIARDVTEERRLRQNMEYYITQITRAQEDERLRISRELHDDTAQVLAGLSRDVRSLLSNEKTISEPAKESLEKIRKMADLALEEVRRFSQDLRPSILDDLGLVSAIEWLAAELSQNYGLETKVSIGGKQRRLSPEKELAIFRIIQEALSNARRHSAASTVEITIDFGEDALTLIVSDNGQGFRMPQRTSDLVVSGKLGIIGMRERARLAGGTLIVQSEFRAGTTITVRVAF